jgi:very-short-patch-repair endonuclease
MKGERSGDLSTSFRYAARSRQERWGGPNRTRCREPTWRGHQRPASRGWTLRQRITRRLASSRLHRIHRGVYSIGHPAPSKEGRWMAAVLACGEGAALSHRSAAELWKIRPQRDGRPGESGPRVEVTVPGYAGRAEHRGINLHRSSTLGTGERTLRNRIPVTTPARTVDDLHRVLPPAEFAAALREAEYLRLAIGRRFKTDGTRTDLEARMLGICRRHRLPKPAVNAGIDRYRVDFLWADRMLVAEVDGWESHRTRSAFEVDRARDVRLALLGYEVVRFTWRQIGDDGQGVAKTIRALLRVRS